MNSGITLYASQLESSACETETGTTDETTTGSIDRTRGATTRGINDATAERSMDGIMGTDGKTDSITVRPAGITLIDAALETATKPIIMNNRSMMMAVELTTDIKLFSKKYSKMYVKILNCFMFTVLNFNLLKFTLKSMEIMLLG